MKVFQNKNLFKKLILILVLITIVSFCIPKGVSAKNDGIGGKLLNPIMSLFVSLGDGIMTLLQKMVLEVDETLIPINSSAGFWSKFIIVILTIAAVSVILTAAIFSAGTATVALAAAGTILKGITVAVVLSIGTLKIGYPLETQIIKGMLPDNFQLPMFVITPQEIFSNKIPLLDVDFFNPQDETITKDVIVEEESQETVNKLKYIEEKLKEEYGFTSLKDTFWGMQYNENAEDNDNVTGKKAQIEEKYGKEVVKNKIKSLRGYSSNVFGDYYVLYIWDNNGYKYVLINLGSDDSERWRVFRFNSNDVALSDVITKYIRGEDTNFEIEKKLEFMEYDTLKFKNYEEYDDGNGEYILPDDTATITIPAKTEQVVVRESTAKELQSTIASWYVILRNISLVALLSILVYVGIRILISSTSSDKAKYKQMLLDWIVAVCLLFLMQYIMSFSNILVKKIIDVLDSTKVSATEETQIIEPEIFVIKDKEKIKKAYEVLIGDNDDNNPYSKFFIDNDGNSVDKKDDATALAWPAENFMQQARLKLQLLEVKENEEDGQETYIAIGWKLIYVVLVIYTLIFLITYIKRVIYMAFLTIIAPLVAMTYPIDKMNDGKAQAFDMWFKEYIFNLLIQPMHLILYTVLIGSAMELASKSIIYVVIALGFMIPAEKILRKFFGFEKAQTPGMLGGAAGAALMWNGVNRLMGHKPPKGPPGGKGEGKAAGKEDNEKAPRFKTDFDKDEAILNPEIKENKNLEETDIMAQEQMKAQNVQVSSNSKKTKGKQISNNSGTKQTGAKSKPTSNSSGIKQTSNNSGIKQVGTKSKIKIPNNLLEKNGKKPKIKRNYAKGIASGAKYYANGMKKKMINRFDNAHPLKTAAGVIGAATFATAGGILGIASGDPSKGFQYAATGAMGGYNFGKGISEGIDDTFRVDGTFEEANRGSYESESDYRQAQIDKYIEKIKKDTEFKKKFEREIDGNKDDVKQIMESGFVDNLVTKGITDTDDIIAAYKLKDKMNLSDDNTAALVKYSKTIGDTSKMNSADSKKWADTVQGKLKKKGASDKKARDKTKEVMEANKIYFSFRNDL